MTRRNPFEDVYKAYRDAARDHFNKAVNDSNREKWFHELDGNQGYRLEKWFRILRSIGVHDSEQPYDLTRLAKHLGFGVWRLDYTREIISYAFLETDSPFFQQGIGQERFTDIRSTLLRIPFGRGTIGYVGENAGRFSREPYLCENSVGDLRGVVSLEDQIIGHINIILYPILKSHAGTSEPRLILSLYLPAPHVFKQEYANDFAKVVHHRGQEILACWEQHSYDELLDQIARPRIRRDADLSESLEAIANSASYKAAGPETAHSAAEFHSHFPWVGWLTTPPVAIEDGGDVIAIKEGESRGTDITLHTIAEPSSFLRFKNIARRHQMIDGSWGNRKTLKEEISSGQVEVGLRLWQDAPRNIVDLVIPLVFDAGSGGKARLVGQVRLHLSRYLLGLNAPDDDTQVLASLRESVAKVRGASPFQRVCDDIARDLEKLSGAVQTPPIAIKLDRQLRQFLFSACFRHLSVDPPRGTACLTSRIPSWLQDAIPATCSHAYSGITEGEIATLADTILTQFPEALKDHVFSLPAVAQSVVGFSFWSLGPELVLVESKGDSHAKLHPPHIVQSHLRDIERMLLFLLASKCKNLDEEITDTFDIDPETGKFKGGQESQSFLTKFYDSPLTRLKVSTVKDGKNKAAYQVEFIQASSSAGQLSLDIQTWRPIRTWPRISAYEIATKQADSSQANGLDRHLAAMQRFHARKENLSQSTLRDALKRSTPIVGVHGSPSVATWRPKEMPGKNISLAERIVRSVASSETDDLSRIWAIPVHIFYHTFAWLLVGVRREHDYADDTAIGDSPILSPTQRFAISCLEVDIAQLKAKCEQQEIRTVFSDCHELRDIEHGLTRKSEFITTELEDILSAGADMLVSDIAPKLNKCMTLAYDISDWCYTNARSKQLLTLQSVLIEACEFARNRLYGHRDRELDRGQVDTWYERMLSEVRREVSGQLHLSPVICHEDTARLLAWLAADVLANAGRHSDLSDKATLNWHGPPADAVLTIENPSSDVPIKTLQDFGIVNSSLLLRPEYPQWNTKQLGLRNIYSWSRRLRVGISMQYSGGKVGTSMFLGHLLADG